MGTLTREKVLELRDQFIHLSEKTYVAAACIENYLGSTTITHEDFAEVGPDLLSQVQGCLSNVWEAMDPDKHWESTEHNSLSNLCVRNDEFLTLAEVAIPSHNRNLIPPPVFPADFGHSPIRFNFQLVWESARFLTFTPGFVDEYLRKWQRGPRPASLPDHWGWDHRSGAILDKPNWDILGKFHETGELLGKIKVIHDSSSFSHGPEMRIRLREEFAAIARECPAEEPANTSGSDGPGGAQIEWSDWLTPKELREILAVDGVPISQDTLKRMLDDGRLTAHPDSTSKRYRVKTSDLPLA